VAFIAEEGGPLLVRGPIKLTLPDGQTEQSERPVAALCLCRRSKTYPWCDTSHRKHTRSDEHEEHG
jgi:CDGSH-type Zn-finger protein